MSPSHRKCAALAREGAVDYRIDSPTVAASQRTPTIPVRRFKRAFRSALVRRVSR